MKHTVFFVILLNLFLVECRNNKDQMEVHEADVIIYGGTSAAVMAAVQVMKMGRSVIVVSPDRHLGGLTTSGLGFTDTGDKEVIGGLAREFYHRIYEYYEKTDSWRWQERSAYGNQGQGIPAIDGDKKTMWIFEPHAAEEVFESFIKDNPVQLFRNEWLDRTNGVVMSEKKIISIQTLNRKQFKGMEFIDATYEGDLMAAAGVQYDVGREGNNVYHETWNGVQPEVFHHGHYFKANISPYKIPGDPSSGLLPRISGEDPGKKGEGDEKIQAYCFRMCLTQHAGNLVPITRPDGYDSTQYELLLRVFDSGWRETFNKFDPIPNLKTDVNNHGPFSFDNIGMSYNYPEATYASRAVIIHEHEQYQKGLLYFIANDPRVPSDVSQEMKKWGLAKDEFVDNENWPRQIYIREARRMIGDYIMTEHEVLGHRVVQQPIGMGSYTMDSHNVQRYVKTDGYVQNEGDIGVQPERPYQIALGSILPKREECVNLLVPVCVSSSHIAFGSIRMEPVFMILGQSAATVAVLALENNSGIHDVEYGEIREKLLADGQVLDVPGGRASSKIFP
jgi:FAD dependent oxidoreductase